METILEKRTKYHEDIRRNHIMEIFSAARIQFMTFNEVESDTSGLIKKSLANNGLKQEIQKFNLLGRLKEKLSKNNSKGNQRFVMVICSNALLDDISVYHKQEIIELCLPICQYASKNVFLKQYTQINQNIVQRKVLTYFYRNVFISFWQFDQDMQQKIENVAKPHLIHLIPILLDQNQTQSFEDAEFAIYCYLSPKDQMESYCRLENNKELVDNIIDWVYNQKASFSVLFAQLSALPSNSLKLYQNQKLIKAIISNLQKYPTAKENYITIANFLKQQYSQTSILNNINTIKIIIQCVSNHPIFKQKLDLIGGLLNSKYIEELITIIIQLLIDVLNTNINIEILCQSMTLIRTILSKNIGEISWNYFKNCGGVNLLEQLQDKWKNKQLNQLIEDVWSLCIDVQL